jgi:hypothetical protein
MDKLVTVTPKARSIPTLGVGAHLTPSDGMCLMEFVSVQARESWTDMPTSVHPLVSHLGRLVNDSMSDDSRQQLAALAPAFRVASAEDSDLFALVAYACTGYALSRRPTLLLFCLHHVAVAQMDAGGARRWRSTRAGRALYAHGPAQRAVEAAVTSCRRLPAGQRDGALLELLNRALDVSSHRSASVAEGEGLRASR